MRIIIGILAILFAGAAMAQDMDRGIGIAAVVDDQVISSVDLSDRTAVAIGTTGIPDTPENRARIAPQILRQLIDEKLQMEEAARDGITISDTKLKEGITKIEKQNNKPPGSLEQFLTEKGLSKLSFYTQVRAQIAWSEIVLKKIRPKIRISDAEVARFVRHKKEPASNPTSIPSDVLIAIIHLPVDSPQNEASVHKLADKLAGEIRSGADFDAVASQFSAGLGSTKASAPFWVEMAQLDPVVAGALSKMPKGSITDPVRTQTGYQIIRLTDTRVSQNPTPAAEPAADAPRVQLGFKQILMTPRAKTKPPGPRTLLKLVSGVQKSPGTCENTEIGKVHGLSRLKVEATLAKTTAAELPEKLRDLLLKLKVGEVSEPISTPQGIRLFLLCEHTDLPPPAKPAPLTPTAADEAARQAIFQEKLELEAQKYMRDLKRDAFVEVRG